MTAVGGPLVAGILASRTDALSERTVTISDGTVYAGGGVCDIGSGLAGTEETLTITGSARVFLQNDNCLTPDTKHKHTACPASITYRDVRRPIFPFRAHGQAILAHTCRLARFPMTSMTAAAPHRRRGNTVRRHYGSSGRKPYGFSYDGYVFDGWNTAADGSGNAYQPGDTLTFGKDDVILYAQWIEILSAAGITGITAPAAGAVPQTAGSLAAEHPGYTVTKLTWQDSDGSPATLTEDGKFKAASTYKAVIELTAAKGHKFQGLTPTVNTGEAAAGAVNADTEGNRLTFTVTFDSTAPPTAQPGVPTILSAVAGNGQVTVNWSEVPASVSYYIYSSTASGLYTSPPTTVAGAVCSCEITGLANGTTYYFVVTAGGPGEESVYSNEASATPRTVPGAPTNVIATAGDGQAAVSFTPPTDNGGNAITGYTVTSHPGNISATGTGTTMTVPGLSNGTAYTFTITAANAAGTGPASPASNAVTPYKPSEGDSGRSNTPSTPTTPTQPVNTGIDILVDGKTATAATATTTKEGGKTVTTVLVDDKKIEERLVQAGRNAVVTIPVLSSEATVVGQLNGQTIKNMETKEAVLEIKTGLVTYTLPASQISIDAVSEQMGKQVELKDIAVSVKISEPTADTVKIVEDTANKNNYRIVVKPVAFEITCSSVNKTVDVSKFNAYVERLIAIPEGVAPSKITTGIVLNEDGTFSHVPTVITVIDGKYYAKINSLTNSVYSIISSPKTCEDAENHWAKEAVNDMASRLVIGEGTDGLFSPDKEITRAEFASIVIKALGLMRPGTGKDIFNDVVKNDWYYDAVYIAHEYGIISGYGNGKFNPEDTITREQAFTMIARAMKITGLTVSFESGEEELLLTAFSDTRQASGWAKSSIASCIKAEIVSGKNGKRIAPISNITRAEAVVIVRKLLQKSGLI